MQPEPRGMAEFDGNTKHRVKRPKKGKLQQCWETAAKWIDTLAFIQLLDLAILLSLARIGQLELLVLVVDRLHLRLNFLHSHRGLHLRKPQRQQRTVDYNGENKNRPAVVRDDMVV